MKKLALILPVILLLILVILRSSLGQKSVENYGPFNKVAFNVQQPSLVDGKFFFFTGSSFAQLDPATGKTVSLSSYFYTKGVTAISHWGSHSVVFSVTGADANDQLGQTLTIAGSDPSALSWWRYDFDANKLTLVDFTGAKSCISMNEIAGSLYCFAPDKASQHNYLLYAYNFSTQRTETVLHTELPVATIQSTTSTLYYLQTNLNGSQALHSYAPSGNKKTIYSSKNKLAYAASAKLILLDEFPIKSNIPSNELDEEAVTDTPVKQRLVLINTSGVIQKDKSFKGPLGTVNASGDDLIFTNNQDDKTYIAHDRVIEPYTLAAQKTGGVWRIGDAVYFARDSYIFGDAEVKNSRSSFDFSEPENTPSNKFYLLETAGGHNIIYINCSSQDFSSNAANVAIFLDGLGYDPNQFSFDWHLTGNSDVATGSDQAITILR